MARINRLKRLRLLVVELPTQLRLAYCLARDPRTPSHLKAALAASLAVILNPAVDLPGWIPVLGQMDVIALTVLAIKTFNGQAPAHVRADIEEQLKEGRSQFDLDLRRGADTAAGLSRLALSVPQQLRRARRRASSWPIPGAPVAWYRSAPAAGGPPAAEDARAEPTGVPTDSTEEHPA